MSDDEKDPRFARAVVLTDQPWKDGTVIDLDGVDFGAFLRHGYVYDHRESTTERLDQVVGRPVSVENVELPDGVRGIELQFLWIDREIWIDRDRFEPGRYGTGASGRILERSGETVMRCEIMSASIMDKPMDPHCYLDIEEGDDPRA